VRLLDADTIGLYIDVDEYVDLQRSKITSASLSDILRIFLLREYGGVWVDATVYCNRPLDEWLHRAARKGFFAFANPTRTRPLSSWFIAAEAGNSLSEKWCARTISYWRNREAADDYFWFHNEFDRLLESDEDARRMWADVPTLGAGPPHQIQLLGMNSLADETVSRVDWSTPVFKLTHRIDEEWLMPGTLLHHLLAPGFEVSIWMRIRSRIRLFHRRVRRFKSRFSQRHDQVEG
jgi:hypothetical protein